MVESNNAINNTVGASISGVTNTLTVTNPSNTANSKARKKITVGGSSSADPSLNFNISGISDFELGIDNSDNDYWKLSEGTALGTNDTIIAYTSGEVTKPLVPSFLAYPSANIPNVTGGFTTYSIIMDTEDYDVGNNFDTTTGIFTAPITGRYLFSSCVMIYNLKSTILGMQAFITIDGISTRFLQSDAKPRDGSNMLAFSGFVTTEMDAGSTAVVQVQGNPAGDFVGVYSDLATYPNNRFTWFSGYLLG